MNYNTRISVEPGLQNTYQVFNLNADQVNKHINVEVIIDGDQYVESDTPQIMHAGSSNFRQFEGINNENSNTWELTNYGEKFKSLLVRYFSNYANIINSINNSNNNSTNSDNSINYDIYEKIEAYKNYKNQFTVIFKDVEDDPKAINTYSNGQYLGYKQNPITIKDKKYILKSLENINGSEDNKYIFINTNIIHYSKYYNIYKSSDISIPILQPVLYTKEDLDKLNMTIHNKNAFINSLSMFTAWNDKDNDDKDYRREYRYECSEANDTYGEFSINSDEDIFKNFNHNAGVEWDYSQFKQHSYGKHFVTELSEPEASEERYNDYFPNGFMFFTLSSERGDIGIDYNNGKNTNNFDKSAPSLWKNIFRNNNNDNNTKTYYISKYGYANEIDNYPKNTILAGLYYRGDKEDNVHLLNCWFTLQGKKESGKNMVTQKIAYNDSYTKKPKYIGTCIASVFVNIYHYVQDSNLPITQIIDTVYLSEHNTTYTKDMVYRISTTDIGDPEKKDTNIWPNTLLVFKGIEYRGYVELVKQNAGANNDLQYSGDKNVNAVIHSCVKNVPLQYKLTYKEPNTDLVNANNDFFLLKTIDNPLSTRIYGKLSTNKLYQLDYDTDGKPIIDSLKSTFKIKYLKSIALDPNTKIISGEFSTEFEQENNPKMSSTWDINNYLTLSNYRYRNIANRYYSIVTNNDEFKISFADFDKDEVLLPFAKFVV